MFALRSKYYNAKLLTLKHFVQVLGEAVIIYAGKFRRKFRFIIK